MKGKVRKKCSTAYKANVKRNYLSHTLTANTTLPMNHIAHTLLLLLTCSLCYAKQKEPLFPTPFENSGGKASATYAEMISYYEILDAHYPEIKMEQCGRADGGYPLHVVYYSADQNFNARKWQTEQKIIILINNAIHAGEPDGVDASMMLLRDVATGVTKVPNNVVLAIIPAFNVGGVLNRGKYSRANQNGPIAYGFRGNAQNLDLNRDFMKCDAIETRSLQRLFQKLDADIFIDNHVSDGADYQHVMTLLPTQHDKLGGQCGQYMYTQLTPKIYSEMKKVGYDLVPYVNNFDNTPEKGWTAFNEPPRFASGYAALFQCLAYVVETHMLKPYKQRVMATKAIMEQIINIAGREQATIKKVRADDRAQLTKQEKFALEWKTDSSQYDEVTYKGYSSAYKKSDVSGLPRLFYDRNKPFSRKVPYYDHFKETLQVTAPEAYIVPRGWNSVIQRLEQNKVKLDRFETDTTLLVTAYHLDNYETVSRPYEKHYLHKNIKVTGTATAIRFKKGDVLISVNQRAKRYLIEALEPTAPDGFFAWNYFDGILSQKEYFGDYAFEDLAKEIVDNDPTLKKDLRNKQQTDTAFAKNGAAQLDFIYRRSAYMEPGYLRYPVFRLEALPTTK